MNILLKSMPRNILLTEVSKIVRLLSSLNYFLINEFSNSKKNKSGTMFQTPSSLTNFKFQPNLPGGRLVDPLLHSGEYYGKHKSPWAYQLSKSGSAKVKTTTIFDPTMEARKYYVDIPIGGVFSFS